MGYDFITEYKQGKENKEANALSQKLEEERVILSVIYFPTANQIKELKSSYNASPETKQLMDLLQHEKE